MRKPGEGQVRPLGRNRRDSGTEEEHFSAGALCRDTGDSGLHRSGSISGGSSKRPTFRKLQQRTCSRFAVRPGSCSHCISLKEEIPGNTKQTQEDWDARLRVRVSLASEGAMRKWLYVTAAISLVSFSISMQVEGQARKDIKSESAKALTAGGVASQPAKAASEDPNYSIAPEDVLTI